MLCPELPDIPDYYLDPARRPPRSTENSTPGQTIYKRLSDQYPASKSEVGNLNRGTYSSQLDLIAGALELYRTLSFIIGLIAPPNRTSADAYRIQQGCLRAIHHACRPEETPRRLPHHRLFHRPAVGASATG